MASIQSEAVNCNHDPGGVIMVRLDRLRRRATRIETRTSIVLGNSSPMQSTMYSWNLKSAFLRCCKASRVAQDAATGIATQRGAPPGSRTHLSDEEPPQVEIHHQVPTADEIVDPAVAPPVLIIEGHPAKSKTSRVAQHAAAGGANRKVRHPARELTTAPSSSLLTSRPAARCSSYG